MNASSSSLGNRPPHSIKLPSAILLYPFCWNSTEHPRSYFAISILVLAPYHGYEKLGSRLRTLSMIDQWLSSWSMPLHSWIHWYLANWELPTPSRFRGKASSLSIDQYFKRQDSSLHGFILCLDAPQVVFGCLKLLCEALADCSALFLVTGYNDLLISPCGSTLKQDRLFRTIIMLITYDLQPCRGPKPLISKEQFEGCTNWEEGEKLGLQSSDESRRFPTDLVSDLVWCGLPASIQPKSSGRVPD